MPLDPKLLYALYTTPNPILILALASGIGLMISRGCVANSCSVILIDVNEEALSKAKLELKKIISSSSPNPAQVQTSAHCKLKTTYDSKAYRSLQNPR
jgi:short-subunit dehydrogenase involved in D-alanine esterification of teichoic acids